VFGKHLLAKRIDLDLPLADHTCPFQTKIDAAYARKKTSKG